MMIKSARTADYNDFLNALFEEAKDKMGYIDVVSKDLHNSLSELPTLPTCCMAMRRMMREGDQILVEPMTKTGFGVDLTIRYFVDNRENRNQLYPLHKRGRKKGTVKKTMKINKDLVIYLKQWLKYQEIPYTEQLPWIIAKKKDREWKILVDIPCRGRKSTFQSLFYHLACTLDNEECDYSICINFKIRYLEKWSELPKKFKEQHDLSLLTCSRKGKIRKIST